MGGNGNPYRVGKAAGCHIITNGAQEIHAAGYCWQHFVRTACAINQVGQPREGACTINGGWHRPEIRSRGSRGRWRTRGGRAGVYLLPVIRKRIAFRIKSPGRQENGVEAGMVKVDSLGGETNTGLVLPLEDSTAQGVLFTAK